MFRDLRYAFKFISTRSFIFLIFLGLSLSGRSTALFIIYFIQKISMGNERSKMSTSSENNLLEQLCSLTLQDYSDPYHLPTFKTPSSVFEDMPCDMQASSLVDEAEETQPLGTTLQPANGQFGHDGLASKSYTQQMGLQKNQILKKQTRKNKKISKAQKPKQTKERSVLLNPQECQNSVDQGMRDQNNCKSYHKLVKNYLIQQGLGAMVEKYQKIYHTRYYFIVCLIIIKHGLQQSFLPIYQNIVQTQLKAQQKKIDKKLNELHLARQKMEVLLSKGQQIGPLKAREGCLQSQIEHIKVVKFEIEDYSVRSCRAFFQGNIEESLKILYLKSDPVMRKKYYFEQALETVKNIQTQMRKTHSHR